MKGNPVLLVLIFYSLFLFLGESRSSLTTHSENDNQVYIVYMGAAHSTNGSLREDHARILNTVLRRNERALIHNYKHGFSGFAARLSKHEANSIAQQPGVVSVFPNSILKLHTTRSWDFLKLQTQANMPSNSSSSSNIVIGVLDTGIWPEAPSFSDKGMDPIPPSWKGVCMISNDFNSSNCNRKIIGARYYLGGDESTPRDLYGHGSHTASTAAGNVVSGASYYGLAKGTSKGGSPQSRLAIYKVCSGGYCDVSTVLAAFDDAIADGVDVLSLSFGPDDPSSRPDLKTDSTAIGAFHAMERGIMVVCSAGNSGPKPSTVSNDAPWILTVGATTIDRDFQSNVVLGNGKVIKGRSINFSPLSNSPDYPLAYCDSARDLDETRKGNPNSLDKKKVKGKIVVCVGSTEEKYGTDLKIDKVKEAGVIGLVYITDHGGADPDNYGDFPNTVVTTKDAATILHYMNSTSKPLGTILPTVTVLDYKPAPMVATFSSRGPSSISKNILKPDIAAPGIAILAAWSDLNPEYVPKGKKPSPYNIVSGTSMSCPHVSGLAGSIKSRNPTWSVSAIKSAIMTSATQINNLKGPITTDLGSIATPYDYGAGEITPTESFQPGLVYETSIIDYLNYLCYIGYNTTTIKVISETVPDSFSCPKDSTRDLISNINYPSIAISNFNEKGTASVIRTVTNVGEANETVYSSIIDAPDEVKVDLIPDKLQFTENSKTLSYQIIFSSTLTSMKEDLFGSITWSNGKYTVRSPFVLAV